MTDAVLLESVDPRGVARLEMNRPDVKNAFNGALIRAIKEGVDRAAHDPAVRVIVLTGAGSAFSAGADLQMMRAAADYSEADNLADAMNLARMLRALHDAGKPTIARVNGPAMGGGVGLVAACDIAIASDAAFFALSEVRLGLIPAVISPYVVAAMGARAARRVFLTGARFDAEEARRIGLVHEIAPAAGLDAAVDAVIEALLAGGPQALREARALIDAVAGASIDLSLLEDTASRIARLRASEEGKEGVGAFLEKRKPHWVKA